MRSLAPSIRLALALALFLALIPSRAEAQVSQILEIASDSLTSYRYTGNTLVQGVRPQYNQRGVTIDGAMRSAPAFPMVFAGNPFENAWTGRENYGGIRADLGAFAPQDIDIALPTDGIPWVIGRTYNARQLDSGGSAMTSNGYQGKNWFQTSQPEIRFYDDATNTKDLIYIVYGADRYVEFARAGTSSNQFKGKNGAAGCVNYVSGSPDTYVYTDQHGNEWTFFGFNTSGNTTDGQFWKVTTPNSKTSFVGDASTASTAISSGFSGGKITTAYDASDRRFTYTYTTLNGTSRLTQVKAETKTGGTWASSPTGVATAVQADYTYYADESHGDIGDLKQVKITTRLNDSAGETIEQVKRKHYRYWEGSADDTAAYNSSTNPGYPHALKYVYDFEGVRVYDWLDSTFDEDHLSASDATLETYASAYFEYESGRKIREAWFDGQCGCGGGSDGTFAFTYGSNGSYTNSSGYDTAWCIRTVIERPDASFLTQYFDEVGQGLSRVISDADPSGASSTWVTYAERDGSGLVTTVHTPENLEGYTHSTGAIDTHENTDATCGLIHTFTRVLSGDLTGFVSDRKHAKGTSGTASDFFFDGSQTFTSLSKSITDVTVVRPLIATNLVYSEEIYTGSSGAYTTSYSYAHYGADSPIAHPLTIEKITQTNPTVATANNGSNSATTTERHYRRDALIDFQKHEDATIEYWEYTHGQVTKHYEDVDTSHGDLSGVTIPSGFASTGTELHRKTTTSYTSQGFKLLESPPENGNLTYLSRLADHRLVVLQYADYTGGGTPTYYGPVNFRVQNQAGKVEAQGIVKLSAASTTTGQDGHVTETDSDPITALDVGTVAQVRTSVHNETGHEVEESRVYFTIPGSSPGTEGTDYDATRFAYDDSGRRIRTKEPSGTIRRTTYDLHGHGTEERIGTNDNGLPGGESSGTSNMLKVSEREYDAGSAGKNSNLTKISGYKDSSNKDDTTLTYDYRGRRILELPALAPFAVHKYDNMGRLIATGLYSSSSGLTISTDPTSATTNRMALTQTFFDEMGRVWKSQRHKIDDADGSDDDNLQTLNWYNRRGILVKTDGSELKKTKYDRLRRVTDEYVLAKDDDTTYGNVVDSDDLTVLGGDIVLEERQTRYDSTSGTIILQARIDRFHDDYSTGETSGVLDTNADSLPLKLTFTNLEGRAQITALWYDSLERLQDQVEYGTNGGSDFNRSGLSVPSRSDTALRTTWAYNYDGTVDTITDPKAIVTKRTYDAQGRITKEVKNYVDGTPGTGADDDVTVIYEYTKGLRTKLKADLPSGEADQETIYIYGSTKDTPSQMKIATGHLLRATKYPDTSNGGTTVANIDSDASDVVSFAYDAQGREVYRKDQAGNIFESDYDANGRQTQRRVTTLAGGFDSAIWRIATTYDSLGRTSEVVQYDNATVGSGTATDGVKYTYDDWGQIATYAEDRDSAVTGAGNQYTTSYTWAKATTGRNTLRKSDYTLPSGRVIDFQYRTAGGLHDGAASRVTFVVDNVTNMARYWYNGIDQVAGQEYDQPDVMWRMYGSSGTYPDLDGFNRVVSSRWTKDLTTDKDFYSVALTYDRNSNITSADDSVHAGFDVIYSMDDVNRLTRAEEGTLGGGSISSRKRDEQWTLTHTGNWELDKVDLNGDGDFVDASELNDDRTHNDVNELTARDTDDNGSDNYSLTYDAAGNMTDDGKDYEYEYDAFYRLRKVKNTSNQALIAEYRYNGLGHRIGIHEDTEPDGDVDANDKWYYDAFDERWRHMARFRESDSSPKEDFVSHQAGLDGNGGASYIDLVVCRNKDANTAWTSASDGNLEERIYYCQNWRADVSVILAAAGTMKEWVKYSGYGVPMGVPGGDTDSDGDCDSSDVTQVQTWVNGSQYDVRGDINLDGVVDVANDKTIISSDYSGITLGRGALSATGVRNTTAFAGYRLEPTCTRYDIRYRHLSQDLGRWLQRDPLGVIGTASLAEYASNSPVMFNDPTGAIGLDLRWGPRPGAWCQVRAAATVGCTIVATVNSNINIGGQTPPWRLGGEWGSGGGRGFVNGIGHCQGTNSTCSYVVTLPLKVMWFQPMVGWRGTQCDDPTQPHGNAFYYYWHGIRCGSTQWRGAGRPGGAGVPYSPFPTWTAVGFPVFNHDGHSEVQIRDKQTFQLCDLLNPQRSVLAWTVTAAGGGTLSTHLECWCSCGSQLQH